MGSRKKTSLFYKCKYFVSPFFDHVNAYMNIKFWKLPVHSRPTPARTFCTTHNELKSFRVTSDIFFKSISAACNKIKTNIKSNTSQCHCTPPLFSNYLEDPHLSLHQYLQTNTCIMHCHTRNGNESNSTACHDWIVKH